jgi:hypothetical protein
MSRSRLNLLVALAALLAVPTLGIAQSGPPSNVDKTAEAEGRKVLAEIRDTQKEMATIRARLMGPVKVNDKVIPADQVRREAVFLVGVTQLELKILEFIVAEWQKNGIEEDGRKPEEFKLDEKKIEADIKQSLDKFRALYPNLDFWEVVRAQTGLSKRQHIQNSRVTSDQGAFQGQPERRVLGADGEERSQPGRHPPRDAGHVDGDDPAHGHPAAEELERYQVSLPRHRS